MPKLDKRLTDTVALKLPLPTTGHDYHWCKDTPGFGLRVSATGDRAYIFERRVDGKTVRRTLGKAAGAKAISADAARKLKITVSGELQTGVDRLEIKREVRKVEKLEGITLASALTEYTNGKRRGKDGLALKDRTKHDYMGMVATGGTAKDGKPFADGALHTLADKSLSKITADDMRRAYAAAESKSKRQAVYAMQVLRAVLNWHGVAVPDSPLSKATAGKNRIILASTEGNPTPIPPEQLGAWWAAATARTGHAAADGCRLVLLTGCRPGEIFGNDFEPGLYVRDVDLIGARLTLIDTKNRKDHTVMLSTQALAILKPHCIGKKDGAKVFDVIDPGKTLDSINSVAGVTGITPHKLRHTFTSVAEDLVSAYALKKMVNHTEASDVTGSNYVGKSENQLRVAWQTVADFIANSENIKAD
jgi:integrase